MKILMIGAHQDDNEFKCGGIASMYAKGGHEVRFLSICNGCGGHHIMGPKECSARRAKESAAVAKFLGITYDVWDIDDCNLASDLETRKRLIKYIRSYNPELIISHRPNDYHADHRAAGQLVQDATYLLTIPNECPEVPALRFMPVLMSYEDRFTYPPFRADVVVDIDSAIDTKFKIASINESQVYEWLPYNHGETVPKEGEDRFEWMKGMNITPETTDEEILNAKRGFAPRFAKTAIRFRKELIEKYGEERGSKIRFAEAFEVSEYGAPLTEELKKKFFPF